MKIGNKITIKVIFKDKNDKILILKKACNPSPCPICDLPGGGLEIGETFKEGIFREIKEELNIEINVNKLELFNNYIVERTENYLKFLIIYSYPLTIKNITLSSEHYDYFYASFDELKDLRENTVIFNIIGDYYDKN
ncbi:MAG: NUDIX domain-containing protein [Bacilli bacterium]